MYCALPDLTPSDSHSLWYTSSRYPFIPLNNEPLGHGADPTGVPPPSRRQNQAALDRTPLARLRADETYQTRRKLNIANFGAGWLRPPGVTKTLYQMREERREQEEHAEAMRREQLAQQLAEAAEAEAGDGGTEAMIPSEMLAPDGEPMDADEMAMGMDEERDLDDEIPDADVDGFGYDGADSDDDGSGSDDDDDDDDDDATGPVGEQREMRHARAHEDRVREMMARGEQGDDASEMYGGEGDLDDEDQAQMLEEDDLVRIHPRRRGLESGFGGAGDDMDMEADLDDDIPEAADLSAGYEHTDTEAELSSSDGDGDGGGGGNSSMHQQQQAESSFVAGASSAPRGPRSSTAGRRLRVSLPRSDRNSLDLSGFLSRDGSSIIGSSPQMRRRG